ncbi:MAG TPA: hypothetical protein VE978_13355 [Chitinophagales bacterium]|nr:hypothetical protein [Chitinophagales bacterium]
MLTLKAIVISSLLLFGYSPVLFSQNFLPATIYDYRYDAAKDAYMTRDTQLNGYSDFVTVYNIYLNSKVTTKPLLQISITNYYHDRKILLEVDSNPRGIHPKHLQPKTIKYDLDYGMYIIPNANDTLKYGSDSMQYELLLYFTNISKRCYVLCSQIGESKTGCPYLIYLDPVPTYLIPYNDQQYSRFLYEGTDQRRKRNWQQEQERIRQDSIKEVARIKGEQRIQFLGWRDTTYLIASADTAEDYSFLLQDSLKSIAINFMCKKIKYKATLRVEIDTLGAIRNAEPVWVDTSSKNYSEFEESLINGIQANTLYPHDTVFQGQKFSMFTEFNLNVSIVNDTMHYLGSKRTDTIYFEDQIPPERIAYKKLMSAMDENGKYTFRLCYSETFGVKTYSITNLMRKSIRKPDVPPFSDH